MGAIVDQAGKQGSCSACRQLKTLSHGCRGTAGVQHTGACLGLTGLQGCWAAEIRAQEMPAGKPQLCEVGPAELYRTIVPGSAPAPGRRCLGSFWRLLTRSLALRASLQHEGKLAWPRRADGPHARPVGTPGR